MWQSPDPILESYMNGEPNAGVFNPFNLNMYTYTYNNPVTLTDPDGEFVRILTVAGKFAAKAYKTYKKTGKLDSDSLKKAGLDELVGIADDLNTVFNDADATMLDRLGAAADLVIGTETTDGEIRDIVDVKPSVSKTSKKSGVGSYTNVYKGNKKYHGKGPYSRQKASSKNKPSEFVYGDYTKSKNSREAFKDESRRMHTDKRGARSNDNYNRAQSPGDKYRQQDSEW